MIRRWIYRDFGDDLNSLVEPHKEKDSKKKSYTEDEDEDETKTEEGVNRMERKKTGEIINENKIDLTKAKESLSQNQSPLSTYELYKNTDLIKKLEEWKTDIEKKKISEIFINLDGLLTNYLSGELVSPAWPLSPDWIKNLSTGVTAYFFDQVAQKNISIEQFFWWINKMTSIELNTLWQFKELLWFKDPVPPTRQWTEQQAWSKDQESNLSQKKSFQDIISPLQSVIMTVKSTKSLPITEEWSKKSYAADSCTNLTNPRKFIALVSGRATNTESDIKKKLGYEQNSIIDNTTIKKDLASIGNAEVFKNMTSDQIKMALWSIEKLANQKWTKTERIKKYSELYGMLDGWLKATWWLFGMFSDSAEWFFGADKDGKPNPLASIANFFLWLTWAGNLNTIAGRHHKEQREKTLTPANKQMLTSLKSHISAFAPKAELKDTIQWLSGITDAKGILPDNLISAQWIIDALHTTPDLRKTDNHNAPAMKALVSWYGKLPEDQKKILDNKDRGDTEYATLMSQYASFAIYEMVKANVALENVRLTDIIAELIINPQALVLKSGSTTEYEISANTIAFLRKNPKNDDGVSEETTKNNKTKAPAGLPVLWESKEEREKREIAKEEEKKKKEEEEKNNKDNKKKKWRKEDKEDKEGKEDTEEQKAYDGKWEEKNKKNEIKDNENKRWEADKDSNEKEIDPIRNPIIDNKKSLNNANNKEENDIQNTERKVNSETLNRARTSWFRGPANESLLRNNEFINKLVSISKDLDIDPNFILRVMYSESWWIHPCSLNNGWGDFWLIQFHETSWFRGRMIKILEGISWQSLDPKDKNGLKLAINQLTDKYKTDFAIAQLDVVKDFYQLLNNKVWKVKNFATLYLYNARPSVVTANPEQNKYLAEIQSNIPTAALANSYRKWIIPKDSPKENLSIFV